MSLEYENYDSILLKLRTRATAYLNSKPYPTSPKSYELKRNDVNLICPENWHHFKHDEKVYGKAVMNTKICLTCLFSQVEVFPPRRKGDQ